MMIRACVLACLLTLSVAAAADARQASFNVSISGTQTSRVSSSDRCNDGSGAAATRSGSLSETISFRSTRAGRVSFKSVGKHGLAMRQSTNMLGAGSVSRDSSLDERGITPAACAEVVAATGCASRVFDTWRLSFTGGTFLTLRAGPANGGDPFRNCQNPFDGFPHLVRRVAASVNRKAIFKRKKRTLRIAGKFDGTREFADGYTGAKGAAATSLRFTATLTRR